MENTQNTFEEDTITPIIIDEQKLPETKLEEEPLTEDKKFNKLNLPKRKYAIIHGYNGYNYSGNQK